MEMRCVLQPIHQHSEIRLGVFFLNDIMVSSMIICLCYLFSRVLFYIICNIIVCLFCKRNSKNKMRKPIKVILYTFACILRSEQCQTFNRRRGRRWQRRQRLTDDSGKTPAGGGVISYCLRVRSEQYRGIV